MLREKGRSMELEGKAMPTVHPAQAGVTQHLIHLMKTEGDPRAPLHALCLPRYLRWFRDSS